MASLEELDPATLGSYDRDLVFEPQLKWTHFLYQVAHVGQPVASVFPAGRVLAFCDSRKQAEQKQRHIEQVFQRMGARVGPIRIGEVGKPFFLIGRTPGEMSQAHQDRRRREITQQFISDKIRQVQIFQLDWQAKNEEKEQQQKRLEAAKAGKPVPETDNSRALAKIERENEHIRQFNERPWVQAMRRRFRIDDDILVKEGSAMAAVADTKAKWRIHAQEKLGITNLDDAEKWAVNKMNEPRPDELAAIEEQLRQAAAGAQITEEELQERTSQGNTAFPATAKTSSQNLLLFSYILDQTAAMEPVIIVHGYCSESDIERGKEMLRTTVANFIEPLTSHIYPMYEWMCPYDLEWFRNSTEAINLETDYSATTAEYASLQQGRAAAQRAADEKIKELRKLERTTESAVQRVYRILGITEEIWEDAKMRLGDKALYDTLFDLPSVRKTVEALRASGSSSSSIGGSSAASEGNGVGGVLMGDVFNERCKLTEADMQIVRTLFANPAAAGAKDYTKVLDSVLDEQ